MSDAASPASLPFTEVASPDPVGPIAACAPVPADPVAEELFAR